uniref:Uncharacterized protein n=1 Tax=Corvus moneduloides TaxID=1196302 RepID=A0A8C3DDX4_CORMO
HLKTNWLKISLSILLSVITLATILANVFVVITIFLTRKLHTPANYLIGSLAVTDLLVSVLVMPVSIAYTVTHTWAFGQLLCDIWLSSDITCCTASILHLCVIALDRYWAITDALEYTKRRTAGRAALMIAVVWMISISISVPPFFWRQVKAHEEIAKCTVNTDQISYTIYSTCGAFYIPTVLLLILYGRIYVAARSRILKPPSLYGKRFTTAHLITGSAGSSLCSLMLCCWKGKNSSAARERKATKTLGISLGAFIFCWLPFFYACWFSSHLLDFFTWLGYLNSLCGYFTNVAFEAMLLVNCRKKTIYLNYYTFYHE